MARFNQVLALAASLPLLAAGPLARAAEPTPPAPPTTTAPTSATTPPSATAPTTATTPPAAKAETKPLPPTQPGGYRLRNIKGEMAYCRTVTPIGTTLPKQECLTPDALAELLKHGQSQSDGLLQHMGICGAAGGASGCGAN